MDKPHVRAYSSSGGFYALGIDDYDALVLHWCYWRTRHTGLGGDTGTYLTTPIFKGTSADGSPMHIDLNEIEAVMRVTQATLDLWHQRADDDKQRALLEGE